MTLDQLQIFLAVAEHLHFTRAAEALYITQPAVSAAIQNLEEQYDLKLFHRLGRRVELTQAGELLRQEAKKILDQVSLTERGLRELNDLQQGELHLGASQTVGNYWLPPYISKFKQAYPKIRVYCHLGNSESIALGTFRGQFDLGFVEGPVKSALQVQLHQQFLQKDRLLLVVGPSHPWFERLQIPREELLSTLWVLREPGSGTRQHFEETLHHWQLDPGDLKITLELSSGEMVKAVVEEGVGATAISGLMVLKELALHRLRSVQATAAGQALVGLDRDFTLLWHRERFQTRMAREFLRLLEEAS